jgi:hypothetical protein
MDWALANTANPSIAARIKIAVVIFNVFRMSFLLPTEKKAS